MCWLRLLPRGSTLTRLYSPQRSIWPSRTLASAVASDGSTPATATNRAEATLKRFWKSVEIKDRGDSLVITLDSRALKTPGGNPLHLPRSKLIAAALIVTEWENQRIVLKSHALPMTSLAARAIDAMNDVETRKDVRTALLKYLDTDTIWYCSSSFTSSARPPDPQRFSFHQDYPDPLVRLQEEHWSPLLAWARDTFNIELYTSQSVLFSAQPDATKKILDEALQKFDSWQMAVVERATYTTKSLIIALALVHGRITAEQAALASQVEVASQIERWGEVEDSHDVDYHDVRRHIGSAACLLASV
ncbi:ATP12-domain-containing protein [Lactarius quietus]|nr:ATP12-domain-containing protein [Lactarius quietus]